MKKRTKRIFKYILEFLIVGFGVFLGIYVSEWQSEKNNLEDKEKSMVYLLDELNENKSLLEKSLSYHQAMKVRLDSTKAALSMDDMLENYFRNEKFKFNELKGWYGIYYAKLNYTAFETLKISGLIKNYDVKDIQEITNIYSTQDTYSDFGASLLDRMLDINSTTTVMDVIIPIELMSTDLAYYEEELLMKIIDLQKKLQTEHNKGS